MSETARLAPAAPPVRVQLSRRGSDGRAGRASLDRGCCLTFHRAVPTAGWNGLPNRGFHIDLGYLERLLVHVLRRGWAVVTMDEALRRLACPGAGPFINISIDDCYTDTAAHVVPLFRRLGVPVTLYVTTGGPDGTLRLRDAGLETVLQRADRVDAFDTRFVLDSPAQRRAAFTALSAAFERSGDPAAYPEFCARHGFDADALDAEHRITWDMLRAMRGDPCVEIGAHTVSHQRISALDPADADAEIAGSRARLEAALGIDIRHFAFPYGRQGDCGPRDFTLVRAAGFASAATTRKGLLAPGADPFHLPRNTLNGHHRWLPFAYAHLSGVSGLVTRMLGRG